MIELTGVGCWVQVAPLKPMAKGAEVAEAWPTASHAGSDGYETVARNWALAGTVCSDQIVPFQLSANAPEFQSPTASHMVGVHDTPFHSE